MVDRVLLGKISASSEYGLRISKPGIDVKTAGLNDLTFDSQATNLRILMRGTIPANNITSTEWRFQSDENTTTGGTVISTPDWATEPMIIGNFSVRDVSGNWKIMEAWTGRKITYKVTLATGASNIRIWGHCARGLPIYPPFGIVSNGSNLSDCVLNYIVLGNRIQ